MPRCCVEQTEYLAPCGEIVFVCSGCEHEGQAYDQFTCAYGCGLSTQCECALMQCEKVV